MKLIILHFIFFIPEANYVYNKKLNKIREKKKDDLEGKLKGHTYMRLPLTEKYID